MPIRVGIVDNFTGKEHGFSVLAGFVDGLEKQTQQNVICLGVQRTDLNYDGTNELVYQYDLNNDGQVDVEAVCINAYDESTSKEYLSALPVNTALKAIYDETYGAFDFINCSFGGKPFYFAQEAERATEKEWTNAGLYGGPSNQTKLDYMRDISIDRHTTVFVAADNSLIATFLPENYLGPYVIPVNDPKEYCSQSRRAGDSKLDTVNHGNGIDVGADDEIDVPIPWEAPLQTGITAQEQGNSIAAPREMAKEVVKKFQNPTTYQQAFGATVIEPPCPYRKD